MKLKTPKPNHVIVYRSLDDGTLYPEDTVDYNPSSYIRCEIPDKFVLTAEQVCFGYGDIGELLIKAGIMKQL